MEKGLYLMHLFLYVDGEYIGNPDFSFDYVASDYNDTDDERWKK